MGKVEAVQVVGHLPNPHAHLGHHQPLPPQIPWPSIPQDPHRRMFLREFVETYELNWKF